MILKPVKSLGMTTSVRSASPGAKEIRKLEKVLNHESISIGIVRSHGGIGDVLMTFPTIKYLKQKFNCNITYITDFGYLDGALKKCVLHNPFIDSVMDHEHYRADSLDVALNLTCPCIAHEVPGCLPIHRIDLFAQACGITLNDKSIDYICTKEELAWADKYLEARGWAAKDIVIVQPYASNERRSYSAWHLRDAINIVSQQYPQLKFLIVQHGTDFDKNTEWTLKNCHPFKNFGVENIAAMIQKSRLVVCPDSSLLHIAGAFEKDCVSLFGPTDPRARNYPNQTALWPVTETMHYKTQPHGHACWYSCPVGGETWKYFSSEMIASAIIEKLNISDKQIIVPTINIETF